jgi:UDP-N-acetylmuramyl tripeptide synthase
MGATPQQRKPGLRYVAPVLIGKLTRFVMRLRGGGSTLPGLLTNKLAPSLLPTLAGQFKDGLIFVLGSNGKTTTTLMISEVLRGHGLKVFTNPTGANLPQGITSAILADATLTGRVRADVAVIEVDEGYSVELAKQLSPRIVLSLNVQVDQLYRFYETERVADMLFDTSVFASEHIVINRDDPYLNAIDVAAMPVPVTFFGVAPDVVAKFAEGLSENVDLTGLDKTVVNHDAFSEVLALEGREIEVAVGGKSVPVTLPRRGVHYAVDAAGALAVAARVLGDRFSPDLSTAAFRTMAPAYGRGELIPLTKDPAGELVEFVMCKNGPSLQMNLVALDQAPERVLFAFDEGTPDVSWLYDIDFSALSHVDVVSGDKGYQLALSLEHAGVPVGVVEPDLAKAIELMRSMSRAASGHQTWIVNYELMMIGRKLLGHGDQEVARK